MFDKFDPRSLYDCATQLMLQIGNMQVCTFSTYPEMNEKAFLGFGASLCHHNSKKLVVKIRRRLSCLLKCQNSPQGPEEQSSSRTFSFPCERQPTQFAANLRYSRYLYFYRRSNYCGLLGSLRSTYTK